MTRNTLVMLLGFSVLFIAGYVVPKIRTWLFVRRVLRHWGVKKASK